jgi:hypothetical protein
VKKWVTATLRVILRWEWPSGKEAFRWSVLVWVLSKWGVGRRGERRVLIETVPY